MRRFFIEEIKPGDRSFIIAGPEARHIIKVLRMGRGDRVMLMDGKGSRFQAIIESVEGHEVLVTLEKSLPMPPPSPVEITLCQALLKSRPMDYMVQKTSELGVDRIIPFSSERTVVRIEEDRIANRVRHWREIALNATKQSGRIAPAEIGPLSSFRDLVAQFKRKNALKVIMWEEEGGEDMKSILRASLAAKKFVGVVGPEGGFARKEIEFAKQAGFASVSLGHRVLRAETSAISVVAIVQYEWGDMSLIT